MSNCRSLQTSNRPTNNDVISCVTELELFSKVKMNLFLSNGEKDIFGTPN